MVSLLLRFFAFFALDDRTDDQNHNRNGQRNGKHRAQHEGQDQHEHQHRIGIENALGIFRGAERKHQIPIGQAVKVQLIECIDRAHARISWKVDNNGTVESYSKYMKATERYEDLMNYYQMIIG